MTYDTKSLELARHFLSDYKFTTDEARERFADRLAKEIQATIESWTQDYCAELTK